MASSTVRANVTTGKYDQNNDNMEGSTITEADADITQSRKMQDNDNIPMPIAVPNKASTGGDKEV